MKDKKILYGIIALIAILIFMDKSGYMALITPGVVDDGYILLSDTDTPFYTDVIQGEHTQERLDFPIDCTYNQRNVNEVCHKCRWSESTCKRLGPNYGDISCSGGTKYWTTLGSGYGSCYAVCDRTIPNVCEEDRTQTLSKTFTVPEDFREVWLLVDVNEPADVVQNLPTHAQCTLNGNELSLKFGDQGWARMKHPREISEYVEEGENTIECTRTTDKSSDHIDIDITVYDDSNPCMQYRKDNCRNVPLDISPSAAPNCGELSYREPKKCVYDDWNASIGVIAQYGGGGTRPSTTTLEGSETQLELVGNVGYYGYTGGSVKTNFDMTGKSFKADLKFIESRDDIGAYKIKVAGIDVYASAEGGDQGLLEVTPRFLNPDIVDIYMKGQKVSEINIANKNPSVEFAVEVQGGRDDMGSSRLYITNPRIQLPFNCKMEQNDLLAMESFSGDQELGLYSFRYPVKSFCLEHPIIVTSSTEGGSTTTAEPYNRWIRGNTTYIPSDQTWTVFYIMENPGTIPVTCPDEYYNVETGQCTSSSGVVQICSEGQFDPELGVCVVQPDSVCAEGYFDTTLGQCVYHPPIQYVCPQGEYNDYTGKCEYEPEKEAQCEEGYTYNPTTDLCEFIPETQIVCPEEMAYSAELEACVKEGRLAEPLSPEEMCADLGGSYSQEEKRCLFDATHKNWCIQQGFDYDEENDVCTYIEEIGEKSELDEAVHQLIQVEEETSFIVILLILIIVWYITLEAGPRKGVFRKKRKR